MRTLFSVLKISAFLGFALCWASAEGVPAGSQIENRAAGYYLDPIVGGQNVVSNVVRTKILAICSVGLSPKSQTSIFDPGEPLVFPFHLVNSGNDVFAFALNVQTQANWKYGTELYSDLGEKGIFEPGIDLPLSIPGALKLPPDGQTDVLLVYPTPKEAEELSGILSVTCPGGATSSASVKAQSNAKLVLSKQFSKEAIRAGESATVTLNVQNTGKTAAQQVIVEDLLNTPEMQGLDYVPNSASPVQGAEFLRTIWGTAQDGAVGVRWSIPKIEPGETFKMNFAVQAKSGSSSGKKTNVASAGGLNIQNKALTKVFSSAVIRLKDPPKIALGPLGNPKALPGGEGSNDDRQEQSAVLFETVCFPHSLINLGEETDALSVEWEAIDGSQPAARLSLANGQSVDFPVNLAPGETLQLQTCYVPQDTRPFTGILKAASAQGALANRTRDAITSVKSLGVALGPIRNPRAPEDTEADTQTRDIATVGREICFDHTLENTGDLPDRYTVQAQVLSGSADVRFELSQPVALGPGSRLDFKVCYLPKVAQKLEIRLLAVSERSAWIHNATLDRVKEINQPEIHLGPTENPRALARGEGSPDDVQNRAHAVLGFRSCFDHTLENAGRQTDEISLSADVVFGKAEVEWFAQDGTPLVLPLTLSSGEKRNFRVCYRIGEAASGDTAFEVTLTARSTLGAHENLTIDRVAQVLSVAPRIEKRTSQPSDQPLSAGDTFSYDLEIENPYDFALHNLVIKDVLSDALQFVSSVPEAVYQDGVATWSLATLAPHQKVVVQMKVKVKEDTPDATEVLNRFSLSTELFPEWLVSNPVQNVVWTTTVLLEKRADQLAVSIGDRLGYQLTLSNTSKAAILREVTLLDPLPKGLIYIPGTAKVDGKPIPDPKMEGNELTFALPDVAPGERVTLSFMTQTTIDIEDQIRNVAVAKGRVGNTLGQQVTVTSNQALAKTPVQFGVFAPKGEIVGRVYWDTDEDRVFDPQKDKTLANVRILLSDGRSVLTDAQGRYHFQRLDEGIWALRLDPNSTPLKAVSGTQSVYVSGLSTVDFAMDLQAKAELSRTLFFTRDGLGVVKEVVRSGSTYQVTLKLRNTEALVGVSLEDSLPSGAQLISGNTVWQGDLPPGEHVYVYSFKGSLQDILHILEPKVHWRMP